MHEIKKKNTKTDNNKKKLQSWTKVVETYENYHHIFPSCEFFSLPS